MTDANGASRMRSALAWTFYGLGHAVWVVFDQWLPWIGLRWPLYRLYSGLMTASDVMQGDGPGPWGPIDHVLVDRGEG